MPIFINGLQILYLLFKLNDMACYKYIVSISFLVYLSIFSNTSFGQHTVVTKKKIARANAAPADSLAEANALVFQPRGYEKIIHPEYETENTTGASDSGIIILKLLTAEERAQRQKIDPYLVFREPVIFKKDAIFIGYNTSWIRLSDHYTRSQEMWSAEEQRQKHKYQFVNYPEPFGLRNTYSLLQDVDDRTLKLINADSAFVYDTHHKFRFNSDSLNYGCMVVNLIKFDLARVYLNYYYPLGQEKQVLKEINDTWGTIRFKPDHSFTHPDRSTHIPRPKEPDLYFGKFSFLNNPEQAKRDSLLFEAKRARYAPFQVLGIANMHTRLGAFDKARAVLHSVPLVDSVVAEAVYTHLIENAFALQREDSAWYYWKKLKHCTAADNVKVLEFKGILEQKAGDIALAEQTFGQLLARSDSFNIRLHMLLVKTYILQRKHDIAIVAYDRLLNIFKQERWKQSRKEDYRFLQLDDLAFVTLEYARLCVSRNETAKAIELLNTLIEDDELQLKAKEIDGNAVPYGITRRDLMADAYLLVGMAYGIEKDADNATKYLVKAQQQGKKIPTELEVFVSGH